MRARKWAALAVVLALLLSAGVADARVWSAPAPQDESDNSDIPRISVDELILMLAKKQPVVIIDDRNPDSYDTKIKGALQIPNEELEARLKEIPRNRPIVTYCA